MTSLHQPPHPPQLVVSDALVADLAAYVAKAQKDAIVKKGRFTVAVSGGSLPKQLNGLIGKPGVKWDKWYAAAAVPAIDVRR